MQQLEKWLVNKFKDGDPSAFETIFKSYHQELLTYARGLIGDTHVSEDIVEELFIWLWENRKAVKVNTSLHSYLNKIVHNRCLNYLKHQKVKQKYLKENLQLIKQEEQWQEDYIEFYKNHPSATDMEKKISEEIEKLPEQCRKIFIMNRMEGFKYREIAEKLNLSLSTVKNQMSIALKKLKEGLE